MADTGFELRDPLFLLAGLLAPLVYVLAARLPATVTYSSLRLLTQAPSSLRARLTRLPPLLLALAVVALAVALARPRWWSTAPARCRRATSCAAMPARAVSTW